MTIMRFCRLGDGRSISYREQGQGQTLVMLHGWGMSSAVFRPLMGEMGDTCRMLVPDLPGHGRSDPNPGYGLESLAADIEEWLGMVEAGDVILLGWSLGGVLALELAQKLGARLRKLILVSSTPCFVQRDSWEAGQPASQVKILARQYKRDPGAALSGFFRRQFEGEGVPEHCLDRLEEEMLTACPVPSRNVALGGLDILCQTDLRRRSLMQVPALVLHGDRDVIIPADAGLYLAQRLKEACWVLLEGAGHAPFITHSKRCALTLKEFIE